MQWQKIALVGIGLMGGSLGLAIKQRGLARRVEGFVRRAASIAECEKFGVVDQAGCDLCAAVTDAELVILCTPIAQMRELAERMVPALKRGAIITDVGSVKGVLVADLEPIVARAGAEFLGSHPMAGAEKMGVSAARANLFGNALCVITPTARSTPRALQKVGDFWTSVGGRTLRLSAEVHDEFVSRSSHLPHIVAAELANYVLSPAHPKEQAWLCANGFRDTTRIASGSPDMWRDIALANRKHLARVLGVFIEDLQEFQLALEKGDAKSIEEFFKVAKHRRDQWQSQTASSSPE
ncbi:MAG: prephenate dehydrogenase/arogenate dehydrogenase family protein [Verrucomicrobia bacterium]|nr:prephenate dehydrogenase/arogenate dehydrogenase family protein [Verrucomicrobiota bacterium]